MRRFWIVLPSLVFLTASSVVLSEEAALPQAQEQRLPAGSGGQEQEKNRPAEYAELKINEIASANLRSELKNKKVKVVAGSFASSETQLGGANLGSQLVAFEAYGETPSGGRLTVLVPKQRADMLLRLRAGGPAVLYGQLMLLFGRRASPEPAMIEQLMLVVERVEPQP